MTMIQTLRRAKKPALVAVAAAIGIACGSTDSEEGSPFASFEPAANEPGTFVGPRSAVPLPDGSVVFVARQLNTATRDLEDLETSTTNRMAVFRQTPGAPPTVLYAGSKLVEPFDIEASLDGATLYIADLAAGPDARGAILVMSISGGEPSEAATGYAPRGVTVANDGAVYFTGSDKESRIPGLFSLKDQAVNPVVVGAPFVDPSGIAIAQDGRIFVADTSLGLNPDLELISQAGIVLVKDGKAGVFASGFVSGYPAGVALTKNDATLIVSGQAPNSSDAVYLFAADDGAKAPKVVTDKISELRDSAAGLKRLHGGDTFAWASLEANGGGTVYVIKGK